MEPLFIYAFKTVLCSGALFILYRLVLEGKTNYMFSRTYLVSSAVICAVIPALSIPVYAGEVIEIPLSLLASPLAPAADIPYITAATESTSFFLTYPMAIYMGVCLFFLTGIVRQLSRIHRYKRGAVKESVAGSYIYHSEKIKTPFTFFRSIFIPSGLNEDEKEQIITHELSHAGHHHSAELLFMELMKTLFWFNPFLWLSRRALAEVHEYEADHAVISTGYNANDYKNLLFRQLFGYSPDISNGLACSRTKKRFLMMNKNNPGPKSILRAITVVPVIAGMLMAFSFTNKAASIVYTGEESDNLITSLIESISEPAVQGTAALSGFNDAVPEENNDAHHGLNLNRTFIVTSMVQDQDPVKNKVEVEKIKLDSMSKALEEARLSIEEARRTIEANRVYIDSLRKAMPELSSHEIDVKLSELEGQLAGTLIGYSRFTSTRGSETDSSDIVVVGYGAQEQGPHTFITRGRAGDPIVLIDGVRQPAGKDNLKDMDPNSIHSISVLKNSEQSKEYGDTEGRGVILITTKLKAQQEVGDDEPFMVVETMPTFQGGDVTEFRKWVMENLIYPPEAVANKLEGRVVVSFIIKKDGALQDISVVSSPSDILSAEVVRVVSQSPKWTPGKQRGNNVNVRINIPVNFNIP